MDNNNLKVNDNVFIIAIFNSIFPVKILHIEKNGGVAVEILKNNSLGNKGEEKRTTIDNIICKATDEQIEKYDKDMKIEDFKSLIKYNKLYTIDF